MIIANRKSQVANPRSAFTLIEILLAIGILAIGTSTVLFLFTMGARSHRRAVDRTRAALLADAVFNQIGADLAGELAELPARYQLSTKQDTTLLNQTLADFPEFTFDVTFAPLYNGDYYVVRVSVWFGDPSLPADQRTSETFETILRRKNF